MTKESKRNINRVTKYNSHTSRVVDNINPLNTYNKEFSALDSSAILDIDIKEMPNPCTINPPITDSWCITEWNGDWVGGGQTHDTCFAAYCCGGMLINWRILEDSFEGTSDYIIDYRETYYEVPITSPEMTYYQKLLEQAERNLETIRTTMENRLNYIYPIQLQALIDIYEHYEGTGQGAAYFCGNLEVPQYNDSTMPLSDWYMQRYGEESITQGGGSWIQFWNFCFLTGYPVDHIAKNLPTYTNPIAPESKHLGSWYRPDLLWDQQRYENGFYPFYEQTKYCVPFIRSPYEYMGQVDFDVPRSIEELTALKAYWDLYVFDYSWFEQQVADAQARIDALPLPPEVEPVVVSYAVKQNGIVVPEDGCYLVTYKGKGWGASYFDDAIQRASILVNDVPVSTGENNSTGVIWTLGPPIYYWPPITNLVAYVEARAGDIISCFAEAAGYHKCYPWVAGSFLKGDYAPHESTLSIKLVASAEGVRPPAPKELFVGDEYQEDTVVNPPEFVGTPTGDSLQAAIDATSSGGTLDISGLIYTGSVIINKPMTLKGGAINVPNSTNAVSITAGGVTLDNVTISGLNNTGQWATGIYAFRANGLIIKDCHVEDFPYAGIMILETSGGEVYSNFVKRIGMNVTGGGNAYGIAVSNLGGMQSSNINVHHNDIDYVPNWHGLDTHAGINCKFNDNTVSHCNRAIFITGDSYGRYASSVEVSRNICDTPTPRDDVRYTYPYNEVGITVVTGCTVVYGDANELDGWPTGNAIDTQNSGAIFTDTVITNPY